VPDFYQGAEVWDFSLVDPDNRRPVDYERRKALLNGLDATIGERGAAAVCDELISNPRDDRMKLYTSSALLRYRRCHLDLFQQGAYQPLAVAGARRDHVFAFARTHGTQTAVIAVPRLPAALLAEADVAPVGESVWGDTTIDAPREGPSSYRHVLTGAVVCACEKDGRPAIRAADLFAGFPVAVLEMR
jgi:(1->4)-alpha-D-glucan 1-alpha-D-glucosylmutase